MDLTRNALLGALACHYAQSLLHRAHHEALRERQLGPYVPYREPPTPITPLNLQVDLSVKMHLEGGFV